MHIFSTAHKRKVGFASLFLLLFLFIVSQTPSMGMSVAHAQAASADSSMVEVLPGALNVRSGPGGVYNSLEVVFSGELLGLIGRNADTSWLKVWTHRGVHGWVHNSSVSTTRDLTTLPVIDELPPPPLATVLSGALNVRFGPGLDYPVVSTVPHRDVLHVSGRNPQGTWVRIWLSNGVQGWVNAKYVKLNLPILSISEVLVPPVPGPPKTAVVMPAALNVRYGPGLAYRTVSAVSMNQTIYLSGRNPAGTWARMWLRDGTKGWVSTFYINSAVPIADLPEVLIPAVQPRVATRGALNVRSGPGLEHGVLAVVQRHDHLGIIGRNENGTWLKVWLINGLHGWVKVSYLDLNVPVESLPVQ